MTKINTVNDLENLRNKILEDREKFRATLVICGGTGCQASRAGGVIDEIKKELDNHGLNESVCLRTTGCHGFCEQGPLIVIEPDNLFYCHVTPDDVHEIITKTILNNEIVERLLYTDPVSGNLIKTESEIPFYKAQDRQILTQNRQVDPCSIEDYIAIGGYTALGKTLFEMSPESVVQEIMDSELRGRGGGGFPTGLKWAECREAPGDEKYVICNADEGDPGAYMDRCVLEGNPHLVLEGMLIGAWAIGASQGHIYVRNEYPLAVDNIRVAVQQARESGLLGDGILGSKFSFDVEISRGGGAFVCGESTALMASLEGKVGEPKPKDVHTVIDGLWHKPTTLNNVETWANVPAIMKNGSSAFAAKGSKGSKGTKILALTGCIKNTGLVEVEMGTPIKNIVFDIGGGANNEKPVKAVQTGGPSGGCLPVEKFDLPVDFDELYDAGSMIGSGGMVVMDEETCMVDVAKYFLTFLQDESCGKCVPCRIGVSRMLEIVTDITEGRGKLEQINLLEELGDTLSHTALCGLGKTAANPVLSTLRYFREEYEIHIEEKKCPAGVCQELITYAIDPESCTFCGLCKKACPHNAITGEKKQAHEIDLGLCIKCGICRSECKFESIIIN
ncbi:MAG: 4Fe-4S binding protein [Desulfobacterales bacterium]|jgi:NADH:ubiquinone oxidoreductase subunit F (NADH-binding)/(2Fe-2S) ferredoxin/Pyruvate/2-oxoacid:ferredoxin oxidoreductase delta subunit|nr:4Fe-4S binding protein [Desulfobacteraceae bacterium]MBT7085277.1 4Fe-4S binding protein [Desulfobacterales bacterium]MBT7698200.1 4Fe-4S binding protein [Desulfobacterales bacterium]